MSFKEFDQNKDIQSQLSVINEIVPLTGTFFSGTDAYSKVYVNITSGSVVSGGFFQTVYDGAPTSLSSSALIDFTYGHSSASLLAARTETFLNNEKQRIYKQMAGLLLGSEDSLFSFNSQNCNEVFFLLLKRRIYKDEIKKGNTQVTLHMTGTTDRLTLFDTGAASAYSIGPAGDQASLYSGSTEIGKVYYNAGIIAIRTGSFVPTALGHQVHWSGTLTLDQVAITGNIDHVVNGLRNHLVNNGVQFHNQTNLHSTIYFCRATNSEFNYSTNPTFLDSDGRIIPTSGTDNQTRTYITKVGLYDINDNLLAVGSLSQPVKKSPDTELGVRVKLSY